MQGSINYNENLLVQIDDIHFDSKSVNIKGWAFAQVKIIRLEIIINGLMGLIFQVDSFGITSLDVAHQFGDGASHCRFDESIQLQSLNEIKTISIKSHFISGRSVVSTIYRDPRTNYRISKKSNLTVGIGVCSFNRPGSLDRLLRNIRLHTMRDYELIVADDGSSIETLAVLEKHKVPFITGKNRGVAWNKNRAIYYLNSTKKCDVIILLEDDTFPTIDGWEENWINGAMKYGHLNLAGHWFVERFIEGGGTVDSPTISTATSGQCVSFSRTAIERVGYFDSRFGRYGYEHVEHTQRCIQAGFGGFRAGVRAQENTYILIKGDIYVGHLTDLSYHQFIKENRSVYESLHGEETHRWAWRGDDEMAIFLDEQVNVRNNAEYVG